MLSYELEEKVLQYVNYEISLEQLEDWLVPRLPAFLVFSDSSDSDVVAAIELSLAEISDGIRTEDELRDLLFDVLRKDPTTWLLYPSDRSQIDTSSSINKTRWTTGIFTSSTSPITSGTSNATTSDVQLAPRALFTAVVVDQG
jgi:hypothetical protein